MTSKQAIIVVAIIGFIGLLVLLIFRIGKRRRLNDTRRCKARAHRSYFEPFNYRVTTIITTAPQPSIPSPKLVIECLKSLKLVPPILEKSPIIIGFDGCEVEESRLNKKCTRVFDCSLYKQYKDNVKREAKEIFPHVEFVELPTRGCLTSLLRACMQKVSTKLVNVMQQDLPINKEFDVEKILRVMESSEDMDLVRYSRNTNRYHENYTRSACGGVLPHATIIREGIKFTQCSQWADNNHIAKIQHYNDTVWPLTYPFSFMEHDVMCYPYDTEYKGIWYLGEMDDGDFIVHTDGRSTKK